MISLVVPTNNRLFAINIKIYDYGRKIDICVCYGKGNC